MNLARALGIALQLAVLGEALFFALSQLWLLETGARLFRYAGF